MPEETLSSRRTARPGEQDCRDPRKIYEGLWFALKSEGRGEGNKMSKRQRRGNVGGGCGGVRAVAQRKSKCARVISLPCSPHPPPSAPRVFFFSPLNGTISLERNFPDIRSAGFHFRFLFCASSAAASLPVRLFLERVTSRTQDDFCHLRQNLFHPLRSLKSMRFFSKFDLSVFRDARESRSRVRGA